MSTAPCPFSFQQRKTRFPSRYDPGQTTGFPISCIFSSRAAIARNGFVGGAGAYVARGLRALQPLVLHRLARVGVQRLPVGPSDPAGEHVRVESRTGVEGEDFPPPRSEGDPGPRPAPPRRRLPPSRSRPYLPMRSPIISGSFPGFSISSGLASPT